MTSLLRRSLLSLALLSTAAFAGDAADITVDGAFVRLMPVSQTTTAAYLTINNAGAAKKLVKADSNVANAVELHNHVHENGVMKMRQVKDIEVPAKGKATLQPGGLHIMLIGLKAPLQDGQKVPLTLTFDDGNTKQLDVPVSKGMPAGGMGGMGAGMQHMHGHDHNHK